MSGHVYTSRYIAKSNNPNVVPKLGLHRPHNFQLICSNRFHKFIDNFCQILENLYSFSDACAYLGLDICRIKNCGFIASLTIREKLFKLFDRLLTNYCIDPLDTSAKECTAGIHFCPCNCVLLVYFNPIAPEYTLYNSEYHGNENAALGAKGLSIAMYNY